MRPPIPGLKRYSGLNYSKFELELIDHQDKPDGGTNLPPGGVDAKADAAPVGATNRETRRPSLGTPEAYFCPRGTIQSDAANEIAHADLAVKIQEFGLNAIEGAGSEEGTAWPSEKGYFALGLALEPSKNIGTHFDQDAIVWVGPDAVPQLILLR